MEHSIENQLQLPIVHAGVEFPRLLLPELIKWAAEVKASKKMAADVRYAERGAGGKDLSRLERQQMIQSEMDKPVELGHLLNIAREPAGMMRVLVLSLQKAGKTDAEALGIINSIHPLDQFDIVQGILSPPAPIEEPAKKGEDEPPLPEAGNAIG